MGRLPPRSQRRPSNSLATASSTATAPVNVVQPSGSKPKRGLHPIRQNHISHWRKISISLIGLGISLPRSGVVLQQIEKVLTCRRLRVKVLLA
jgi:hypothetical protein